MNNEDEKNVLIALLKEENDEHIAAVEHWYRIPKSTKKVPKMIKDSTNDNLKIKYIAFYLPKKFNQYKWSVPWLAEVKDIKIVKGKELIYKKGHPKANKDYYKIEFDRLEELPKPIYGRRGRRILFITTTERHLKIAEEINDLFYESPLEETMWSEFKKLKIQAERQWELKFGAKSLFLDFALFCHSGKIDVECDGDTYHMEKESVEKDKDRDTLIESKGWKTMRFTSTKIYENLDESIGRVMEAVDNYGGLEIIDDRKIYRYLTKDKNNQSRLFE
jgi:very-short-patch-repair endonuclease